MIWFQSACSVLQRIAADYTVERYHLMGTQQPPCLAVSNGRPSKCHMETNGKQYIKVHLGPHRLFVGYGLFIIKKIIIFLRHSEYFAISAKIYVVSHPELWIRIRMDPHSFSLLDPDPGGKNLREITEKMQRNWQKLYFFFFLSKCGLFMK